MNILTLDDFRARLKNVKGNAARCPAHDDHNNSFSFGQGDKGGIVFTCHAGCDYNAILAAMGLIDADVMLDSDQRTPVPRKREQRRHEYPGGYKVIFAGKGAAWYHYEEGKAVKGKPTGITVYNPDALQGDPIYIAEGEKDVDTLTRLGKSAVCSPDGAGKPWKADLNHLFTGKYVVVLGDNDKPGRTFAIDTANNLHGVAKTVKLVDLTAIWPDMPEKADITDYIERFGDSAMVKVDAHADQLPDYKPGDVTDETAGIIDLFIPLEDYSEEEATWLVNGWIPEGQITLLAADGGVGKTTVWCNIIAALSNGTQSILDAPGTTREPMKVTFLTTEDSVRKKLKKNFAWLAQT